VTDIRFVEKDHSYCCGECRIAFKNGEHNSERVSTLNRDITPVKASVLRLSLSTFLYLSDKKLSILGVSKEFYSVLEQVSKLCPEAASIASTIKEVSHIK